ncbi:MAG: hypothetical protein LBC92_05935 [Rickettsiales bacterium]|jgi:hypothetical protein|nr:hypothetical protein [Rickettsiales bacterium]
MKLLYKSCFKKDNKNKDKNKERKSNNSSNKDNVIYNNNIIITNNNNDTNISGIDSNGNSSNDNGNSNSNSNSNNKNNNSNLVAIVIDDKGNNGNSDNNGNDKGVNIITARQYRDFLLDCENYNNNLNNSVKVVIDTKYQSKGKTYYIDNKYKKIELNVTKRDYLNFIEYILNECRISKDVYIKKLKDKICILEKKEEREKVEQIEQNKQRERIKETEQLRQKQQCENISSIISNSNNNSNNSNNYNYNNNNTNNANNTNNNTNSNDNSVINPNNLNNGNKDNINKPFIKVYLEDEKLFSGRDSAFELQIFSRIRNILEQGKNYRFSVKKIQKTLNWSRYRVEKTIRSLIAKKFIIKERIWKNHIGINSYHIIVGDISNSFKTVANSIVGTVKKLKDISIEMIEITKRVNNFVYIDVDSIYKQIKNSKKGVRNNACKTYQKFIKLLLFF